MVQRVGNLFLLASGQSNVYYRHSHETGEIVMPSREPHGPVPIRNAKILGRFSNSIVVEQPGDFLNVAIKDLLQGRNISAQNSMTVVPKRTRGVELYSD
jgi:hypothetical protein